MANITIRRPWRTDEPVKIDNLVGQIATGEGNAHTFVIYGVDGSGETVPITGTITGYFLRADGNTVLIDTGDIEDGEALVTLPANCYNYEGRFALSIFASTEDSAVCIYCAVGNVFRTQTDTTIDPGTIMPSIADLIDEINAAIASIPPDYSTLVTRTNTNATNIATLSARVDTEDGMIETLQGNVVANTNHIGTLNNLVTPTKTNLVQAINEAYEYDPTEAYDTALSGTSENAVQNKVIKQALDAKMNTPVSGGTAGQCLMSDGQGSFVWGTPTEVSVTLGDLAVKDRVQATYTPAGTISAPSASATSMGIYVDRMTTEGTVTAGTAASCVMPVLTTSVANENLTFSWTAGSFTANIPTLVTMPVFDRIRTVPQINVSVSAPTFTGTEATITST